MNKNVLQIENEFYSPIRPKRNAKSGETPTDALLRGGIEYIEIRALDVNPFAATGIDIEQIHFLDVFLTYCLLKDSPTMDWDSQQRSTENLDTVVSQGRALEVMLNRSGNSCSLATWGAEIFAQLQQVAAYMDNAYGVSYYSETITRLSQWIADPELTYSGRYVSQLKGSGIDNGYFALSLAKSYQQQHQDTPYKVYSDSYLKQQADQSVIAERELKAADNQTFNAFLDDYFATK